MHDLRAPCWGRKPYNVTYVQYIYKNIKDASHKILKLMMMLLCNSWVCTARSVWTLTSMYNTHSYCQGCLLDEGLFVLSVHIGDIALKFILILLLRSMTMGLQNRHHSVDVV